MTLTPHRPSPVDVARPSPSSSETPTTTPCQSSFRVDRVTGLTTDALDLDLTHSDILCVVLDRLEEDLAEVSATVSEALYALVPKVEDKRTRRVVLDVRRCCAGSPKAPSKQKTTVVSEALAQLAGPAEQSVFATWIGLWQRHTRLVTELESTYRAEVERATETLRRAVADERTATGIAQACPWLGASLASVDLRPGKRDARSVGSYTTRAARKTSPFSFFTSVGSGDSAPAGETITISTAHLSAWLTALAGDEELIQALDLEPLATPGHDPATDEVLVPEVSRQDGFTWRTDRSMHLGTTGNVLATLQGIGRRPARDYLEIIGGRDPFATVSRLLDAGMMRTVAPWGYKDQDRLTVLAQAVRALGSDRAQRLGAELLAVQHDIRSLEATTGVARAKAILAVQKRAEALIAPFGVTADDAGFTVYSDTTPNLQVGELGTEVTRDLERIGNAVRPLIFRSHLYDLIRDRFVDQFGVGGRCEDVYGFLGHVSHTGSGLQGLVAAARQDEQSKPRPGDRAWLPVGASSAPPTTSVLYQLAGADRSSIQHGRFDLVINQFHSGTGGMVSRFRDTGPHGDGLQESLRAWAEALYPGAHCVEFIPSSGVNDMQSVCRGTLPPLRWPTEVPVAQTPHDSVDLDDLILRHDAARDVLEFETTDGRPIAPIYLGLVPAHLLGAGERILSTIADPWINGAASSLRRVPTVPDEGGSAYRPRAQRGRVVTERATWSFSVTDLPRPDDGESDAAYLRRLNTWRRAEGLPDHVFVRRRTTGGPFDSHGRKPMWLSFLSPHSIAQLLTTVDDADEGLSFVEVLPADHDLWLKDADGHPRVIEHLTHLRWARPSTDRPRKEKP